MCLLALFYRMVDDAPLVVGANREEFYARQSLPPQVLDGPARAVAGLDALAGGTWLGVNESGLMVAVTNRHKVRPVAQPRSRGLLVRELLGCRSTKAAIELATRELDLHRYQGCNVVCGDGDQLVVFQAGDWLRIKHLPPGLHVLTNHDINDTSDPRLAFALSWLAERHYTSADDCVAALRQLCSLGGSDGQPAICLHGKERGTVSSTLLVLRKNVAESTYLHAPGPPDRTPYQDYSPLLRNITT
jgi:uncharacterized protein with NRDE domain